MEINVSSREEISTAFGAIGQKVGPRTGPTKRTHDEKEYYCLRQYVEKLGHQNLISFPLKISKGERPDFLVSYGGQTLGLEITEATTRDYQRELTLLEKGHHSDDSGEWASASEDGWAGEIAERDAAAAVLRAARKKLVSVAAPTYRRADRYEILIYLNVRGFFADANRTLEILVPHLPKLLSRCTASTLEVSISILWGDCIVFDLLGDRRYLTSGHRDK